MGNNSATAERSGGKQHGGEGTPPPAEEQLPLEESWSPTVERPAPAPGEPATLRQMIRPYSGPRTMVEQMRMAAVLANARTAIPYQFRNEGDLLALMQHAIALNIELSVAWDNLVFGDNGTSAMRGRLMAALVMRAGHEIIPVHVDSRMVRMQLKRGDGRPSGGAQWTLAEAQRAGLTNRKGSPWLAYSEDMLWWRCLSRLIRRYASDVTLGLYAAEELGDIDPSQPEEGLEPVDMSTAVLDLDGNPQPAPDVAALLADLGPEPELDQWRQTWKRAGQLGILGSYAGTIDGIHMTVQEVLYDIGERMRQRAEAAQRRAAAVAAGEVQDLTDLDTPAPDAGPDATPPAEKGNPAPEPDPLDAPAGEGTLPCGCDSKAVLMSGYHRPDCRG